MSNFMQKVFLQSRLPLVCSKRFRGKINIQRPKQPHYERARVLELVKPIYKKPELMTPCLEESRAKVEEKNKNPYEQIIAREVRNWLNHSRMVAFVHVNSIKQEDFFKAQVALHRYQMSIKMYSKSIIQQAVDDTKFEAIRPLFDTKTALVFCPDESKIRQLLNVLKKTPQFILLAGIIHDKFLSKNEFVDYSLLPDLTTTRAQLAAVLDSAGSKIVSDLQCHQQQLVSMLDLYGQQGANDGTSTDSSNS